MIEKLPDFACRVSGADNIQPWKFEIPDAEDLIVHGRLRHLAHDMGGYPDCPVVDVLPEN